MKTIPIHLDDGQYDKLIKVKGKKTWVDAKVMLTFVVGETP